MTLNDLQYRNGDGWVAIPSWAISLICLGRDLAENHEPDTRIIAGLAVPTRAYAASLIATGLVIERAKIPFDNIGDAQYIEYLKGIEPGRALIYRSGDDCYHGEFIGIDLKNECPTIEVTWKRGKQRCKCSLPLREARKRLEIIGKPNDDESERTGGEHRIVQNKQFLKNMLGTNSSYEFAMRSRLECIIIGCVNKLRYEIKETEVSFNSGSIEGTFQDVLRVRKFLSEGSAYRANVMPADREQAAMVSQLDSSYMVIFDGAIGFLKWRDYWHQSNWLVLLDKTESCFNEAVDQLNKAYVEKRISDKTIKYSRALPQGIEIITFLEKSK